MSPHRQTLVMASVLDRLLDDEPGSAQEAPGRCLYDLNQHKQSVAQDLEALLNARSLAAQVSQLDRFPQARDSFLGYGIADLGSLSLLNPDHRMLLRDQIRRAIERHEPRLARVRVSLDVPGDSGRILRFRVEALLRLHPHRLPAAFDALLELSSNACQVRTRN